MVLHNNKWDRRAKVKYMKKHGVTSEDLKKPAKTGQSFESDAHESDRFNSEKTLLVNDEASSSNGWEPDTKEADANDMGTSQVEQFDLLPEYEENAEESELIRKHITQFQLKKEDPKSHIQYVDRSVFDQAHAGLERSRLNQRVRTIGKKKHQSEIDLDSDSDFEEFMDNLDDVHERQENLTAKTLGETTADNPKVRISEPQSAFVDSLLR